MRAFSYIMLGVVGTLAIKRMADNQPLISKEMRRMMMRNKTRAMKKIREIF